MILLCAMLLFGGDVYSWRAIEVAPTIWHEATRAGEDPYLVAAMAWVESRWHARAISHTDDCGLMQINRRWSKHSCQALLRLGTNTRAAMGSIKYWRGRFGDDWLCHYNSGNKCYRRSRAYAAKVRRTARRLRRMVK